MSEWIPYEKNETLGKQGSQGGIIVFDEEFPCHCRLTIEKMSDESYVRICHIYADGFRFSFFTDKDKALKSCRELKEDMADWILSHSDGVCQIGWSVFFGEC